MGLNPGYLLKSFLLYHEIMKIEESSRENTDTKLIRIEKSPSKIILISLIFGAWGIF